MTKAHTYARMTPQATGHVGTWGGVLGAELLRTKSSAAHWFPLMGLVIGLLSTTFSLWSSGAHDSSGILSWQAMYVTGMAAPLLALLAGLVETRERTARSGGTVFRPVSPVKVKTARLVVLIGLSAIFHLLNFGVAWLIAVLTSRAGADTILVAGVLAWVGSIATIALFSIISRAIGLIPALIVAVVYQIAGTLTSEANWWWMFPPAWPVRLLLPTLGIHSNAVALEPGHPMLNESPTGALALNLGFAVVVGVIAVVVGRRRRPQGRRRGVSAPTTSTVADSDPEFGGLTSAAPSPETGRFTRGHGSYTAALSAQHRPLVRTAIAPLSLAVVIVLFLVATVYSSSYVGGLYTYALLPLGAGLVPVITWPALSDAWPVAIIENRWIRGTYLLWQTLLVTVLALAASAAYLVADGGGVLRRGVLWILTGIFLVTVATALCVRFGAGMTVAATVLWTVVAATLGGDVLADTVLWIAAIPAWADTADTPGRLVMAVICLAVLIAASVLWAKRELRSYERRG